jgi:hypothetical protein
MGDFMVNYGIIICYILLGVAVAAAVIFPILQLAQNPKGAKGALIGIGLLAVVIGISYALASDVNPSKMEITADDAKKVGVGLYAVYILGAVAIISMVYSEVSKMIK